MSFFRAFLVSVLGTGMSRILGFLRDVAMTRYLGSSDAHDAFQQAFAIPGMFRRFVADEGLTGALIPAIAHAEAEEGHPAAQTLANQVFTALLLVNAVLIALVMAVPEPFTYLVASGYASNVEKFQLTAQMTRWLMPLVGMVSLVSFCEGILNYRGHFFVPKIAPGIVSAAVIACLVLLGSSFQEPAWAVVWGYAIGGVVHVGVHVPLVWSKWGPVRVVKNLRSPRAQRVFGELLKVVGIGVFAQINILVLRTFTSWLPTGSAVNWTMSTRMIDLTQGIIAVAIGSALLPAITTKIAAEDWPAFGHELRGALRLAGFLLIPAAIGLFVYAVPVVSIVFLNDRYEWEEVAWTASAIQMLTPFMLSVATVNLLKRVFFAFDKRNLVLGIGAAGVSITALLGWMLLDLKIVGLAMALSATTTLQGAAYIFFLQRELGDRFSFQTLLLPLGKMALAALPMAAVAYGFTLQGDWKVGINPSNLGWFFGGIGTAGSVYALMCWLLGVEELTKVTGRLAARFGR